jgi:NADPH:quinone reductase
MAVKTRTASKRAQVAAKTMEAAAIDRFGPPEVLAIHSLPVPTVGSGEVLIAVHTAGVGIWDAGIRDGGWAEGKVKFPLVLGSDGSGHVVAKGAQVRRFRIDDAVYAYSFQNRKGGFHAEYVAISAEKAAPIPKGLDLEHAGAIPTVGLTALQGIDDVLGLKEGESIIIHGAGGGVGSMAVQFARARGARIMATASGDDGVEFVRRLGADMAIDGKREDVAGAARNFAPEGADAVLALAGGKALDDCLDALRPGGRLAYPNGVEPEPRKRRGVKVHAYNAEVGVREFQRLNRAVEEADLEIPIAGAYVLEDAARAHQRIEAGHVLGKLVIRIR